MANWDSRWKSWYGKVETATEARRVIRDSAFAFYTVAGLQVLLGAFLGASAFVDAVLYTALGLLLQYGESRVAAVLLLALSVLAVGITFNNQFGGGAGGRNIVLSLIVLWAAGRAVQASFKLHGRSSGTEAEVAN